VKVAVSFGIALSKLTGGNSRRWLQAASQPSTSNRMWPTVTLRCVHQITQRYFWLDNHTTRLMGALLPTQFDLHLPTFCARR